MEELTMKTIKLFGIITISVLVMLMAYACEPEALAPVSEKSAEGHMTFRAVWEGTPGTKTAVQDDGVSVWWTTNESINVFYQGKTGKFTSLNTEGAPTVVFDGILDTNTGVGDAQSTECWAIYPYSESNSFDGTDVTITVPYEQTAKAGSFADNLFPAIARSNTSDLTFYNVCGGVCFTVTTPNISKVVFTSKNGEALTGKVRVGFDNNNLPAVKEFINGRDDLTVSGRFVPGERYYAAILPRTLSGGLVVTYYSINGALSCQMEISRPITVNRSRFGTLLNVDIRSMDGIRMAVEGLSKAMTTQYMSVQGLNGEGCIKTWWGTFGNDLQRCNHTGWADVWNHQYNEKASSRYATFPWFYYYDMIIDPANRILAAIDTIAGNDNEKSFIKAQALTFRAHAFTQLAMIYGYRWQDSNNGASSGVILRLEPGFGAKPLSSLAETYAQIYADLDEAIGLYQQSGLNRGDEFWKPDINVAYAIYTRAALNREDWNTVVRTAPLAREGHPLMSQDSYMNGGFSDWTGSYPAEWIWGVHETSDQTLYFYSFFAFQGSNASSSMQRTCPLAISKELYDQIPETDVRRKLWLGPTEAEWAECNAAGRSTGTLYTRAFKEFGNKLYSSSLVYGYMQFKFQATFMPGGGSFNIYRSAEMYLAEAEAKCRLGNQDASVQQLLNTLNKNLDPAYNCTKTGDDLLTEVKLYRRIDLWGEGFDYYDYKRWNEPIVRKGRNQGGSFHTSFAITINPEDGNRWTFVIPQYEIDRNPAL